MAQIPARKTSNKKLYIGLGVLGVLVLLAIVAASMFGGGDNGTEVNAEVASRRTITQVVTASGRIQPETEVKISPEVSGEIIDLRVAEGDPVQAGDILIRIRPDIIQAQVEQLQAGLLQSRSSLSQSQANLLQAQQDLARKQGLAQNNLIAQAELEAAQTQVQVAEAQVQGARFSVQSAEARLRESREQLANTTIVAPMSGTVSQLNVELGERVVGTSQMAGTELLRIAQLERMEIEVGVNENDIVNVTLGDSALVEVDAYPDVPMRGVVTEIANSARLNAAGTDQVTNFLVKVRVLGVGMPSPGGITTAVAQPEVVIPGGDVQLRPGSTRLQQGPPGHDRRCRNAHRRGPAQSRVRRRRRKGADVRGLDRHRRRHAHPHPQRHQRHGTRRHRSVQRAEPHAPSRHASRRQREEPLRHYRRKLIGTLSSYPSA